MSNERELFEQFANEHKMSVLRVADAYSDDDTNYAWWVWQKARASTTIQDDVRKDAERFVAWFSSNKICDAIPHDFKMLGEEPTLDQWREAIDKARE